MATVNKSFNGTLTVTDFQMTNGAASGCVLTSDANGNATWATGGGSGGSGIGWSNLTNGSTVAGCGTLASGATICQNTYYGVSAGTNTTIGNSNVAVGFNTLHSNIIGCNNIAIGNSALYSATGGTGNIGIGNTPLALNCTGSYNVALGWQTLGSNTTGSNNVALGYLALRANLTGNYNVALGWTSLRGNTSGSNNVALGYTALCKNISGAHNYGIGNASLFRNTTGCFNTAIGFEALSYNTTGCHSVAMGYDTLFYSNGSDNIAIGAFAQSGAGITDNGACNIAIGRSSLNCIDTGDENIALGWEALLCNQSGNLNVAMGSSANHFNSTGHANVALGAFALQCNSANCNVAIGCNALFGNLTGSGNVAIGSMAGSGYTGSDIFWVANCGGGSYLIKGDFAGNTICNGADSPSWNTTSDIRIKENIITIPNAIDTLTQLNPVLFDYTKDYSEARNWDDCRRISNYSFVAQEFEQVFPKYVTQSSEIVDGITVDDFRSINTGHLVPILVKAIQELEARIQVLESQ